MKTHTEDFPRLSEAFARDSVYWGDRPDWFLVFATTRDADTLGQSNWRSFLRLLGGTGTEGRKGSEVVTEGVEIEEASHWACGWVQYLIVSPDAVELLKKAREAKERLDGYPVLDEDDWTALEDEERQTCWDDFARREWFKWFAEQCETEADAEWFVETYAEALETFLFRAYESTCQGCGSSGSSPCRDETLEGAWKDSECAYWPHDAGMVALAEALGLEMKKEGGA